METFVILLRYKMSFGFGIIEKYWYGISAHNLLALREILYVIFGSLRLFLRYFVYMIL